MIKFISCDQLEVGGSDSDYKVIMSRKDKIRAMLWRKKNGKQTLSPVAIIFVVVLLVVLFR